MNDVWIKRASDMNECLRKTESRRKVVLLEDVSSRVGCYEAAGVVGIWLVDGVNENW